MKSHKWKKWIIGYVICMVLAAVVLALSLSCLLRIGQRAMGSLGVCALLILFAAAGMLLTALIGQISILWEKFSLREDKTSETNEKKTEGFLPPKEDRRQEEPVTKPVVKTPEKQDVAEEILGEEDSVKVTPAKEMPQERTEPAKPEERPPFSTEEDLIQKYQKGTLVSWENKKVLSIRPEYLNKTKLSYNTELEFWETKSSSASFFLVEGRFVFPVAGYCERTYENCKNTFDKLCFGEIYDYSIPSLHARIKKIIPAEVVKRGNYYVIRKKGRIEMGL